MKSMVNRALFLSLAFSSSVYGFGWWCSDKVEEVPEIVDEATRITLAQELFNKMYNQEDITTSSIDSYVKKGVDIKNWRDESGLSLADAELIYGKGSTSMQQAGSPLTEKGLEYKVNHMLVASVSGNLSKDDRTTCQRLIQEYKKAGVGLTPDASQMEQVRGIQTVADSRCQSSKNKCDFGTDMPSPCIIKKDLQFIMTHAIKTTAAVAAVDVKK